MLTMLTTVKPNYIVERATWFDAPAILQLLNEVKGDIDQFNPSQFLIIKSTNTIIGCGRVRRYSDCNEIASIVIHPNYQKENLGRQLVEELERHISHKNLYVLCSKNIVPFFEKLDYSAATTKLPYNIQKKIDIFNRRDIILYPLIKNLPHLKQQNIMDIYKQSGQSNRYIGISESTSQSKNMVMEYLYLSPGMDIPSHRHGPYETAIYIVQGMGYTMWGEDLEKITPFKQGDFIYIPPNVRHKPVNTGPIMVEAVICRNSPDEIIMKD